MRRLRRALEVWRRDGLRALVGRVRHRLTGWRPHDDLLAGLDTELPETLVVGQGNVFYLSGWAFHPDSRLAELQVVANGLAHPVKAAGLPRPDVLAAHSPERDPRGHGGASGFTAMVPFSPNEANLAVDVCLHAHLRDGTACSRRLGRIRLEADPPPPGPTAAAPAAEPPPRVAVCMATYNPPLALFERQVQSIRDQTLEDWVCLISDDGSDPDVLARIRRIAEEDPRFRVCPGPTRVGFYRNFERCLSLVPPGVELVALSDHDDHWHRDKLEVLSSSFDADTTLVYSDMNVVDEQGNLLSNTYWTTRANRCDDLASLLMANTVTGAASMFRASLLKSLLPFPQRFEGAFHDHWLACLALSMGRIRYVDRPLHDYVQHGANVLGHFAPATPTAWADARRALQSLSPKDERGRLRTKLSAWRSVYFGELQKVKLIAHVLQARCGGVLTPDKERTLRRLARLDESWRTTLWLALREVRALGRVTETLRAESTLLRGLLWGVSARLRSRFPTRRPAVRPRRGADGRGRTAGLERVQQIEQKIAPLRLRVLRSAPPRINLVIPTIDFTYFFGGYIAKFNLARRLAEEGRRVRVVAVDHCPDRMSAWKRQVRAFEGLEGIFDRVEVALAFDRQQALEVSPEDRFIATTWWTAHIAHRATEALERRRFVYLIQEYEPFTFPMGTFAALARQSYDFPHFAVFSTELLRDYFRENGIGVFARGVDAGRCDSVSFANAITPVGPVGVGAIANRAPRRLLFYARPEAHAARNMFELGVLALSQAIADRCFDADWEFHGLGAVSETGRVPLGGGAWMQVHPRQSQEQYRELLRRHDLGLSLMYTPHPSLVPIEMASAGMLVVTNSFANKTGDRLAAISSNLIVVEPTVEGVARGLGQAAAAIGDYESRASGSRVKWSTDWDASFDQEVMGHIAKYLADG